MTRPLAAVALLALPAVAPAQVGAALPSGPPMLGGRVVIGPPITDGASALFPVQTPVPPRFSVGGGSLSGHPQVWLPSGAWGGVSYPWPVYPIDDQPGPVPLPAVARRTEVTTQPTTSQLTASGGASATLVLQFPAAAEIWVGGKKAGGDPAAEWTLTSPALQTGGSHTFEVKGQWKAGGKTFEYQRSVTVAAGDRSQSQVISGTEVKQ